jgi:hypothetical protein
MATNTFGLLWFDDDATRSLADKVLRAAQRYRQKYGAAPDTCYIHPTMLNGNGQGATAQVDGSAELAEAGVRVLPRRTVLPNHFWLTCERTVVVVANSENFGICQVEPAQIGGELEPSEVETAIA